MGKRKREKVKRERSNPPFILFWRIYPLQRKRKGGGGSLKEEKKKEARTFFLLT